MKTKEELKNKIIQQLRFHRISTLDEDRTAFFIMNLFKEYRSQASALPSVEERKIKIKSILEREEDDFKYKAHRFLMELGNWYNSLASPLLASRDARIKELEEVVQLLADWSRKYPKCKIYPMNNKITVDDELSEIENKAKALTPPKPNP